MNCIILTELGGRRIHVIDSHIIFWQEEGADDVTAVYLTDNKRIVVRETPDEVRRKMNL